MVVGKTAAGHLYSRLIPLVLLLVDGMHSFVLLLKHSIFPPSFLWLHFESIDSIFNFEPSELGSSPIDVSDPSWELYVLIQKKPDQQGEIQCRVLGFSAIYRFYHYPDSSRLRLGQVYSPLFLLVTGLTHLENLILVPLYEYYLNLYSYL